MDNLFMCFTDFVPFMFVVHFVTEIQHFDIRVNICTLRLVSNIYNFAVHCISGQLKGLIINHLICDQRYLLVAD